MSHSAIEMGQPRGIVPREMKVDLMLVLIVAIVDRPTAHSIN